MPKGHSEVDKALACPLGGGGSNSERTNGFNAPIPLGTPLCALSLSQCLLSLAPYTYRRGGRI